MSAPRTARERARLEITSEITRTARTHLAEHGPAGLSLRAVARDLGMASSAVYRYVPSRDALLTTLIIEGYDAVGEAVERAEGEVRRGDLAGRWRAAARAVRTWGHENPHEYALLYGSPVPGYAAPQDTVDPAARAPRVLLGILVDAVGAPRAGERPGAPAEWWPPLVAHLKGQVAEGIGAEVPTVPAPLLVRGLLAWTGLFGLVSFELFGHLVGSVTEPALLFEQFLTDSAAALGLAHR